ncbi:MAG TPA: 4Fe-4S dicluster domain-containing protein [Syntrophorhabdaceae bacterium]|nr:4Fe-4S dicluster domain-containing protein [Syntrophorhabdaceae bacterium]HOD76302.1 4Fe-4S dicluster domain-containing protein [Syntrophorhabdaceae bacterium]
MKIDEKLALDAFKTDRESHILIDHDICRSRCTLRHCLNICPGHLYSFNEEGNEIVVEYAGCLECGTCMVACTEGAIQWSYPRGDFGVQYRYG